MTDREKLIELLKYAPLIKEMHGITWVEAMSGWLVDNGVTVQKWIPVSERLPNDPMEYIVMIKGGAKATTLLFDGDSWFEADDLEFKTYYQVTHWMPLPEAPKEV